MVAVSAVVAALLLPIFGAVDSGPGSTFVPVLVTAAFVLFNRLFDFTATMLRGVGRFTFEAVLQSAGAVVFIVGASIVTIAGLGVTAVLAILAGKELVSAVIAYLAIREDLARPAWVLTGTTWRSLDHDRDQARRRERGPWHFGGGFGRRREATSESPPARWCCC